jgi:hypothetical protein
MSVYDRIPPPDLIRVELARVVREADVLRLLLRAATKVEVDRQFIQSLRDRRDEAARPQEATRE